MLLLPRLCPLSLAVALWISCLSLGCFPSIASAESASACPDSVGSLALSIQLESINGDPLDLTEFPQGLQAVILTNRTTAQQSVEMSRRMDLEFGQYEGFRQVILIDGTGMAAFRDLVLRILRRDYPVSQTGSPYLAVDFSGESVTPLKDLVRQVLPSTDLRRQAVLFLADGRGDLIGAYDLQESSLLAQQCLRQQVRQRQIR
ncbi:MAG: hypothetical protein SNJ85_05380 [Cyanobacteriota bacterium]